MTVRVRFFGPLALDLGTDNAEVIVPDDARPGTLGLALAQRFPTRAALLRTARLAINGRFATPDQPIASTDEIVVIELVGGG